ncbi:TetR/AcrR family transcriptional regulator [Mycobacterium stomatepiae]|uniref:HTH tetR-type domain-containing protein n=1 Tax=Mycobacterium stomatepiae TaxID=470076 RepID=A0A7I7Q9L4_9MYCO|nr:TetR/AcrR family transcriptional regulator [Mycobacterium stomatepiae]MCV7164357.1 TetR/AcrR family transcriptional regulator [Mycobacterium stomatepiae]BBY23018.1 hypothetical protein MSTO_32230 [Mycobacterium stomatepiae]
MSRLERRKQEMRERILVAAFDLFLAQGVAATTIEEICERADVANRTFFNHFPTRQDMIRALAQRRLVNLHEVVFARATEPIPARLIGEMLATSGYGIQRGFNLHATFGELIKEGVSRGEVSTRHDADTLADIIVGALSGGIVNWTLDRTYSLETNLHNLGVALADLLKA